MDYKSALIVGSGAGLSASLARVFAKAGLSVALAARDVGKLTALVQETGAKTYACDAADRSAGGKIVRRARYGHTHARRSRL